MLVGCRDDMMVVPFEDIDTGKEAVKGEIVGMYLLNEGNMGSNRATLDYLDLSGNDPTVHYLRNIYSSRNPTAADLAPRKAAYSTIMSATTSWKSWRMPKRIIPMRIMERNDSRMADPCSPFLRAYMAANPFFRA